MTWGMVLSPRVDIHWHLDRCKVCVFSMAYDVSMCIVLFHSFITGSSKASNQPRRRSAVCIRKQYGALKLIIA